MNTLNKEVGLELVKIEVLTAMNHIEGEYKSRVDAAKEACTKIYKSYKARESLIAENADKFQSDKVADMLFNLRKSVRQSLEELVKGRGFLSEIKAARKELEKEDPRSNIQQLEQTMKEIELRQIMRAAGNDFLQFQAAITDGEPLMISAIENSSIPFPIDPDILAAGKKRRLEVLKPVIAKKFQLLREAQGLIEDIAAAIMPITKDDIDPIRDLLEEAG